MVDKRRLWLAGALLWGAAAATDAQQILLDATVRAGELTLFRHVTDEKAYYYLPNQPHVARDSSGQPEFSFVRWVDSVRGGDDGESRREGGGGGIIHLAMILEPTEEQLQEARLALQQLHPGARIEGGVGFRGGKYALTLQDEKSGLTTDVLGVGNASLFGGKSSATVMLTKQGARILWQAFQELSTPPLAVKFFDMEIAGFRGPVGVEIEADLDEVYKHKSFSAGVAGRYYGADIGLAFDALRNSGAIKERWLGEDEGFEKLVNQTYRALVQRLFEPENSFMDKAAGLGDSGKANESLLARAQQMLVAEQPAKPAAAAAATPQPAGDSPKLKREIADLELRVRKARDAERAATKAADGHKKKASELERQAGAAASPRPSPPRPPAAGRSATGSPPKPAEGSGALTRPKSASTGSVDATLKAKIEAEKKKESLERAKAAAAKKAADKAEQQLASKKASPAPVGGTRVAESASAGEAQPSRPAFAALASFRMKQRSRQQKMTISLNRQRSDIVRDAFDGGLSGVKNCRQCFLEIADDDPLYLQRQLWVSVDGLDDDLFAKYINFVTVEMRKKHAGGDLTHDDVRIDATRVAEKNNRFELFYGWKGDNDRERWAEYEYRPVWSFFGGHTVEGSWSRSTEPAINLAPPYRRRTVSLESQPEALTDAAVRAVTVQIFYRLGEGEQSQRVSLSPERGEFAHTFEFMQPPSEFEYDYEILWRLRGGETVSSGRLSTVENRLFIDELPRG